LIELSYGSFSLVVLARTRIKIRQEGPEGSGELLPFQTEGDVGDDEIEPVPDIVPSTPEGIGQDSFPGGQERDRVSEMDLAVLTDRNLVEGIMDAGCK